MAEKACDELEEPATSASSTETVAGEGGGEGGELAALRSQVASMETELEESFVLTQTCFSENTEYKQQVAAIEKEVMKMTGLFEDCGDLCAAAKTAVCAEDALTAMIDEVQASQSPVDRVRKMHYFVQSQRNSLVEWINEVRHRTCLLYNTRVSIVYYSYKAMWS